MREIEIKIIEKHLREAIKNMKNPVKAQHNDRYCVVACALNEKLPQQLEIIAVGRKRFTFRENNERKPGLLDGASKLIDRFDAHEWDECRAMLPLIIYVRLP